MTRSGGRLWGVRGLSLIATLALSMGCVSSQAANPAGTPPLGGVGIRVSGTKILEANGKAFLMRGTNHPHAWAGTKSAQAFSDIKAAGANTVRVVLSAGRFGTSTVGDVALVVSRCRQLKLVCVLENHDTTSYGDDSAGTSLDSSADFWIAFKDVLAGHEAYVVLNLGNEPFGTRLHSLWTEDTIGAVAKLRNAGFHHALMVDAPDFGQDGSLTMRDNAPAVLKADPLHNVIFDIHMYSLFASADAVRSYIDTFQRRSLALIVGEFSWKSEHGEVDEAAILSYGRSKQIGWLAWSWSGNSAPLYYDMVKDFDPAERTPYGDTIVTGPNGLFATSKEATTFSSVP